jgi:hypothetical protein
VVDGTSCGFAPPTRGYAAAEPPDQPVRRVA